MLFPAAIAALLLLSVTISSFAPSDETLKLAYDRGQRFYVIEGYEQAIEKFQIVKDAEDSRFVDETRVLIRVGELDFPVKVAATFQLANSYRNLAAVQQEQAAAEATPAATEERLQQARQSLGKAAGYYQEAARSTELLQVRALSQYQLVKTFFQSKEYGAVIDAAHALLERYPQSDYVDEGLYEMGWAYYELHQYEDAIATFSRFAGKSTADYRVDRAQFQIAKCYYEQAHYPETRQALQVLIGRYDFSQLSESERVQMEAQKLSGVIKETALEVVAKAQLLIGDTHNAEGNRDQAVAAYQRVISAYPKERQLVEQAYVKIGEAYFKSGSVGQGDLEGGIQLYRRAISEAADSGFRARMQARIAREYYDAGRFPKALEEYQVYVDAYGDVARQGGLDLDRARFQRAQCLFEMAEESRKTGEARSLDYYQQSQDEYLRVMAEYPATALKGECLLGAGLAAQRRGEKADLEKALGFFTQVQEQYPPESGIAARARLQTARFYYAQKAYARAAELYGEYLERYPDSPDRSQVLLEQGLAYRDSDRLEEALSALERIPAESELVSKASLIGGEMLLRVGRLGQAASVLQRGLAPGKAGERAGELQYVLAKVYFEQKNYPAAAAAFTQARQDSRAETVLLGALLGRGTTYFQMADYERAAQDLEGLLAANPPSGMKDQTHRLLGQTYVKMGRRAEAIENYQAIIENARDLRERAEFTLLLAELYYGLARYEEAIEQTQRVIDAQFEDKAEEGGYLLKDRAYFVMGNAYTRLEKPQEAYRAFSRALEFSPRSNLRPDLVFGKGASAFALEKYDEVVPLLQEFIAGATDAPNLESAYYFLAYAYLRQPALEQAVVWFGRLADHYPNGSVASEALFQQGESLFNLTHFADAAISYRKILDRHPESEFADNAIYNLGWCYFELGRTEEAIAQFGALVARFPQSRFAVSAQFSLGDYYFNQNEYDKARAAYQVIVDDYPNSDVVPQAKRVIAELKEIMAFPKYQEAMQWFDKRDYARAAVELAKIIEEYPGTEIWAGALANLGMSYESLNRWKDAVKVYQQLLETYGEGAENVGTVVFAKEHLNWIMTYRL
jgi:tetratricopeptide (TPR) repeat protein